MVEKVDETKCIGCCLCVEICPMDVFRMKTDIDVLSRSKQGLVKSRKACIAYPNDCMTCFTCELKCPVSAISVGYAPPERPAVI
jgi:NAD-dependent dihydropyrimidine dehydrogenase PreA subunit